VSRALDNGAGSLETGNLDSPSPQDLYNTDADYGYSAYDQPYNSITSLVWELPFGKGRRYMSDASGLAEALLGGWQVSGIFGAWSGERVNLRYAPATSFQVSGITQDFRGANAYRPNVVGDPRAGIDGCPITGYFNPANVVVSTDPSQPFGNAERNSEQGCAIYELDMGLAKYFKLPWRDARLQLRFEAFNVLNKTNFRPPNSRRTDAAFGTITSTYDARQIQIGVKLLF
jgi:hypothetical protein